MKRNLTMLMDFYELTMANGYFKMGLKDNEVVFDMFYRKNPDNGGYVIAAGLQQFIEYIQNFHFSEEDIEFLASKQLFDQDFLDYLKTMKFTGDVYAVEEGTIVYPNTPIITIKAKLCEAQLIETMLLLTMNHQSLIATKASRIKKAAKQRVVMEFGARRAQGYDASIYGTRAAYIGGIDSTSNLISDQIFGIHSSGTMAHSWIQYFENEYDAFVAYAKHYPDSCVLLIDTYDVINSGIVNAIRVHKEILEPQGNYLKAVRLDSGDLAYLSKKVRKILNENGMYNTKIIVSNSIDEFILESLLDQQAEIDMFGVGERLITSKSDPVFGGVYKLVAVQENGQFISRIKISETIEKVTNPGFKRLYRVYNDDGIGVFDIIALYDEKIDLANIDLIDQEKPWKLIQVNPNFKVQELQKTIFKDGKLVYSLPSLEEIKKRTQENLNRVWQEEKRFHNPHKHHVDLTRKLYTIKNELLNKVGK